MCQGSVEGTKDGKKNKMTTDVKRPRAWRDSTRGLAP